MNPDERLAARKWAEELRETDWRTGYSFLRLLDALDAAEAIVDRLPTMADGVVITEHGGPLWICSPNTGWEIECHRTWGVRFHNCAGWIVCGYSTAPEHNEHSPEDCYSTREAAEAAKGENDE